jgi:16S rRNA (uracil1498-N3)-methyltransferase
LTSNRFFIEKVPKNASHIHLSGDEHYHLSRVVRKKSGERIWLFDKMGYVYLAKVEEVQKGSTRLLILKKSREQELKTRVTLGLSLIRSKKMDLVIQKATELGVTAIIPVISSRSIIRIKDKIPQKLERWKRISREACKQCGRSRMTKIHPPLDLRLFVNQSTAGRKLYLTEKGGKYLGDILIQPFLEGDGITKLPQEVIVLVGPEGGWTEDEEQAIMNNDFEAVSLGPLVMRSETAAISSLALISHIWNK